MIERMKPVLGGSWIATKMLEWSPWRTSALYAVGTCWMKNRPIQAQVVMDAVKELKECAFAAKIRGIDTHELDELVNATMAWLANECQSN